MGTIFPEYDLDLQAYILITFRPLPWSQVSCSVLSNLQPLIPMKSTEQSILVGLSVDTVAEIAESAGILQRVARFRSDGKVAGVLMRGRGHEVAGTEGAFHSEEQAVAHMEDLVTACIAWHQSHSPACMADSSFTC